VYFTEVVQDDALWAMLAALATAAHNVQTAAVAYGAIDEAEKVQYLVDASTPQNDVMRTAHMTLAMGSVDDAERMYLQAGNTLRAIMLNVNMYRWARCTVSVLYM
jgi:intraflagellar transport protein 80